ncbi:MAG: hypothetical protein A2Y31_01345 [Spirochaetes bacterium GWC2_52_13]|nr:MAG: hypothetical protein A2Y31_01345 [Spirochaetes bacterium GWC2_52_13]HCG62246.1 hypothetical protein [Sphaerochaeta sp.]
MRRIVTILLLLYLSMVAISCAKQPSYDVWYGYSDRYGFMAVSVEKGKAVVVAAIPQPILGDYRRALAAQGIESDNLGAIQSLFGLEANHYLRGDAQQWSTVAEQLMLAEGLPYQGVRPSVDAIARLLVKHAGHLSKNSTIGTLGSLGGPKTDSNDIVSALKLLEKRVPLLRVYDMGRFLSKGTETGHLQWWIGKWTDQVLREAVLEIGVN